MLDFPDRLAGVLFLPGCNLRCGFCHNAALLGSAGVTRLSWTRLRDALRRLRGEWADGLVLTGGEPTLAPELPRLVDLGRAEGFAIKLDTNGTRPDVLEPLLPALDYVAMDLKCDPARYAALTGWDDPGAILASLRLLRDHARDYEVRSTLTPALHDDADLRAMAAAVRGARRWVLQPFVPRPDLPDPALRETPRTPPPFLHAVAERFRDAAGEVTVRGA
jgi:pyruvate formate lyase activating enzyme